MATLTTLTCMLTLSDTPAPAQQANTSESRRPTLPRINTDFSTARQSLSGDESDSSTPLTPVFLSAYPSPLSEDDTGHAPVFTLDIPLQATANVHMDDEDLSDDTDSEPSTPRISIVSPQTPLPSPSPSPLGPSWIPDEHDQPGHISPSGSPTLKSPYETPLFETTPTRRRLRTPKVGPIKFLRALAKGAYGTAFASRDFATKKVICTKVFSKRRMVKNRESLAGLMVEFVTYKQIASASEEARKWLMTMHGALQDGQRVIFAMDLMQCDLFEILNEQIPRPTIRRWIAQIALGIDALHGMGIIHRDIKPENILLCPDGQNIRIADFTNAYLVPLPDDIDDDPTKPLPNLLLDWTRKYSRHCIGTVHYLAPEVVEKKWYGLAVDYWALGCVLYDLLVGQVLFPTKQSTQRFLSWVRSGHSIPSFLDRQTSYLTVEEKDLLSGLLCLDPDFRFRLEHLECHPYFFIDSDFESESTFTLVRSLASPSRSSSPSSSPTKTPYTRPIDHANLYSQHSLVTAQPLCYAKPEACPSTHSPAGLGKDEDSRSSDSDDDDESSGGDAQHGSAEDEEDLFAMFAWVNPSGIWGSNNT